MVHRIALALARLIGAGIPILASLAACSSTFHRPGLIQDDTQLAISPNGQFLLVASKDRSGITHGQLLTIHDADILARSDFDLPAKTKQVAFASSDDRVLAVTFNPTSSELLDIDMRTHERRSIYQSPFQLGFPLEISPGNHVFLESNGASSTWKQRQEGVNTQLNGQTFRGASRLSLVDGNLLLTVPSSPTSFIAIRGTVPEQANALKDASTFFITCADRTPLICLRANLHAVNDGVSYYAMSFTLFNGGRPCKIPGQWRDPREVLISRDGNTIVFHEAANPRGGERTLHIVKNGGAICVPKTLNIEAD